MSENEKEFLTNYQPDKYPSNAYTADIVILTIINGKLSVLLIKRKGQPFKDSYALPGGFVNQDETSEEAASRELKEETGLGINSNYMEQLKTYSNPGRDPRMRVISTAYLAFFPYQTLGEVTAGDDAAEVHFFAVEDVLNEEESVPLAFDHTVILQDALERAANKIEYTTLATVFLESAFTIPELRRVYEAVWGFSVHASNFRRKVINTEGFVEPVGAVGKNDGAGRVTQLYRAGSSGVRILHPAILRDKIKYF